MMHYRKDIDGLRALAILPVVLFHAELKPFGGGFIGVDVFFVISGYLITSLIRAEIQQGSFSIVRFYERRVRRILPALFVILLFASIVAWWLLLPGQYDNFSQSVLATALFVSNVLFWKESGYFDAPAVQKPLLHTWSLAVEEQFYIIFPLFLLVVHRWFKGRWIVWLAPVTILSFAASIWGVAYKPSSTFYLAPTRAWELLLGSLLAIEVFPRIRSRLWLDLMGLIGLAMITWAVFTFTPATPFPGANALYPTVGTALLIYSGVDGETTITKLLGARPLVFLGLVSYSLYLWHWPLLVYGQIWNVYELTVAEKCVIVVFSFLLAVLSWRFVELPFRKQAGKIQTVPLFAGAMASIFCFSIFGLLGHISRGWPSRLPTRVQEIAAYSDFKNPRQQDCLAEPGKWISAQDACVYGANITPTYAVWGDSHADALISMIGKVADKYKQSAKFLAYDSCPPAIGLGRGRPYVDCLAHNDDVMRYVLTHPEINTVIMISRWSVYIAGYNHDFGPAERKQIDDAFITDASGGALNRHDRETLFTSQITKTVKQLTNAGRTVVLVYPVPETGYHTPTTLAHLVLFGRDPSSFTRPVDYYFDRQNFVFNTLDQLEPSDRIVRIFPHKRLCDNVKCIVYLDGKSLYRDNDHLSLAGADYISSLFELIFKREHSQLSPQSRSLHEAP